MGGQYSGQAPRVHLETTPNRDAGGRARSLRTLCVRFSSRWFHRVFARFWGLLIALRSGGGWDVLQCEPSRRRLVDSPLGTLPAIVRDLARLVLLLSLIGYRWSCLAALIKNGLKLRARLGFPKNLVELELKAHGSRRASTQACQLVRTYLAETG